MTTKEILERVQVIKDYARLDDGPMAHIADDELRNDFLAYIARLPNDYSDIAHIKMQARLILGINDIDFNRWYE